MSLRAAEPAKTGPDVVEEPQQSVEDRGLEGRILRQLRKRRRARGYTDNEFNYVDRRTREERERQGGTRGWQQRRPAKHQGPAKKSCVQCIQHLDRVLTDAMHISAHLQSPQGGWKDVPVNKPQRRQPRVINSVWQMPKRQNFT